MILRFRDISVWTPRRRDTLRVFARLLALRAKGKV